MEEKQCTGMNFLHISMRLMMFSLDESLFADQTSSLGDTFQRFLTYAPYFDQFVVLVPTNNKSLRETQRNNITLIPCYGQGKWRFWSLFKAARKLASHTHFDWYSTNDAFLGFLALLLKRKYGGRVQINVFGSGFYNPYWLKEALSHYVLSWIMRAAIRRADVIRSDTVNAANLMLKFDKIPPEKILIAPVTPSKKHIESFAASVCSPSLRKKYLGKDAHILIISVSGAGRSKDIPTLLKAMVEVIRHYPAAKTIIIGVNKNKEPILKLIKNLGLDRHVELLGMIPYVELPLFYASADMFVLSSLHEGLPRVLMEAGLAKLPVVSTAVDGAYDLIENGKNGYICPVADHKAMAKAIVTLLKDPQKRKVFGQSLYHRVREYCDFEKNLKKIVSMWQK